MSQQLAYPRIRPFFSFYGGKYRAAPTYPAPRYDTIIEHFAGSAGYATRYHDRKIILVEKDPVIVTTWEYLIRAHAREIRTLPLLTEGQTIDDLHICQEAKYLIGWWLNAATTHPCNRPSEWATSGLRPNSYWGEGTRDRIAKQLRYIRHWKIIHGDYSDAPDISATHFIDPPYTKKGIYYQYSSRDIDFEDLAEFCKGCKGQVIVCENEGAEWLPFKFFRNIRGTSGKTRTGFSAEAIWYRKRNHVKPIPSHLVLFGNSERLISTIPDEKIALTVTSPPYWKIKDYGGGRKQIGFHDSYRRYLNRMSKIWKEVVRVTVPGGRICINIGDVCVATDANERHHMKSVHAAFIRMLERLGCFYMNTIIWHKIGNATGSSGSRGIMGSYGYPPNGIIINDIEYILIFRKPGERTWTKRQKERSKISDDHWREYFKQVWRIDGERQVGTDHPATFPLEIPRRLISMFSFVGDRVLDPFAGVGTTLAVAAELERRSVGIELIDRKKSIKRRFRQTCGYQETPIFRHPVAD